MTDRTQYPPPSYSQAVTPLWPSSSSSNNTRTMSQQPYGANYQSIPPSCEQYSQPQQSNLGQQQYPQPPCSHQQQPPSMQQQQQHFPTLQSPVLQYPQQCQQQQQQQVYPQQLPTYTQLQPQQYSLQNSPSYSQAQPFLPLSSPQQQQLQQYPPQQQIVQQVIIQDQSKQDPRAHRPHPDSPHRLPSTHPLRPIGPPPHAQPRPPRQQRRMETGKLFNSLGRAVDFMAKKAKDNIARDVSNTFYSPLELLKPGYVVQLVSKLTGRSLRVLESGLLDCTQSRGSACEFTVASSGGRNSAVKFRSVSQPQFYLAVVNGFAVGYGPGSVESDFIPMMTSDYHVTLESVTMPGSHIGVLPSGQLTNPAQTNKMTDAAHFKVKYLRNS